MGTILAQQLHAGGRQRSHDTIQKLSVRRAR